MLVIKLKNINLYVKNNLLRIVDLYNQNIKYIVIGGVDINRQ